MSAGFTFSGSGRRRISLNHGGETSAKNKDVRIAADSYENLSITSQGHSRRKEDGRERGELQEKKERSFECRTDAFRGGHRFIL